MGRSLKSAGGLATAFAGLYIAAGGWTTALAKYGGLWALGTLAGSGQKLEGARLSDLGVQVAQEGAELTRGWGRWRQAGVLVYCPGLTEHRKRQSVGKGGQKSTEYHYDTRGIFIAVCVGPVTRLLEMKFDAVPPSYRWNDGAPAGWNLQISEDGTYYFATASGYNTTSNVRFYTGVPNQQIDPMFTAIKGLNQWTNYPGICGLAIENFYVTPYNNQVPNATFELWNERTNLADIVTEVCCRRWYLADGGFDEALLLDEADIDVSALDGFDISFGGEEGFVVSSRRSRASVLKELMKTYRFKADELDGVFVFRWRGGDTVSALVDLDLRQYNGSDAGQNGTPQTEENFADPATTPEIEELQFYDTGRLFNPGYRYARRGASSGNGRRETNTLGVAWKGNRAERLASQILFDAWAAGHSRQLNPGFAHLWLATGDEITAEVNGLVSRVLLSDITLPQFGAWSASAVDVDPLLENLPLGPNTGVQYPTEVRKIGQPIQMLVDTVALKENGPDMLSRPGVLMAATTRSNEAFNGVSGEIGQPTGETSTHQFANWSIDEPATMGQLLEAYTPGVPEDGYNPAQTMTVEMFRGTPQSSTVDTLPGTGNILIVEDGRVFQFVTATNTGEVTAEGGEIWELSMIQDCRFGSDWNGGDLGVGTKFVILTDAEGNNNGGTLWQDVPTSYMGNTLRMSGFTKNEAGQQLQTIVDIAYQAVNMQPPSPAYVEFSRAGDDARTLSGAGRTRIPDDGAWTSPFAGRMSETPTPSGFKFRVSLTDGVGLWQGDLYTTDDLAAFSWTWSAAQLSAMGLDPAADLDGHVAMYGQFGPGRTSDFGD
jgi:hypothetical protein